MMITDQNGNDTVCKSNMVMITLRMYSGQRFDK
jgi:hypothetical protein